MQYKTFRAFFFLFSLPLVTAVPAHAALTQWKVVDGGNGHFYETILFPSAITWQTARNDALAKGGDLASITSTEENAFVFGLIDAPEFWVLTGPHNYGPWIGGNQTDFGSEPAGGWSWSDGSPWGYTSWASTQPDNNGNAEHHAHYFVPSNSRDSTWNDWTGGGLLINSYVLETIPEPGSATLFCFGLVIFRSLRRTKTVCSL